MTQRQPRPPKLRIGIVGGGVSSAVGRAHMSALRMDGRFEISAAMFSRSSAGNQASADFFSFDPDLLVSSFSEFTKRNDLDYVIVLTPTTEHFQQVDSLLRADQNCIVEKPMALTSSEVANLKLLENRSGCSVVATYNYNAYPAVKVLQRMIADGRFGRISMVRVQMHQQTFLARRHGKVPQPQRWRQSDPAVPMVSLDLGTHVFHLVQFLLQADWTGVSGVASHRGFVANVADLVMGSANFSDVHVAFSFGKVMLGSRNGLAVEVYGEDGSASWTQEQPECLLLSDADGRIEFADRASPTIRDLFDVRLERFKAGHPVGYVEALANWYLDLSDAHFGSLEKTPWFVDTEREQRCIEFFEALHRDGAH